uniref:Alcohol dehydrogenase-like C-terminal domain-containing protein n=1 Tax=Aegilops tauschii subsp. strangulata TaxID=200361 RepID=A0A453P5K1_AEGTS
MGAGAGAGDGGRGGRPAGATGDPRQGRLHLHLPQRRHPVAVHGAARSVPQNFRARSIRGGRERRGRSDRVPGGRPRAHRLHRGMHELQALRVGEKQHVPDARPGEEGRHAQRPDHPLLHRREARVPLLRRVELQRVRGCPLWLRGQGQPHHAHGQDMPAQLRRLCRGLGAAWNVADVSKGSSVVIFGLGTVGLSVAQGAKLRGASKIIGVDTNPDKQEKGKAFGVTDFINPAELNEPVQQVVKWLTDGGADYSFECVGDTGVVSTALQSCSDGWGLTVTLGVPKAKPEVSAHYGLLLSGRTLKGSLFGGWRPKSDIPLLVEKYANKEIQVDGLVTHDMPFSDINKALELMLQNRCLRCVIHMPKRQD